MNTVSISSDWTGRTIDNRFPLLEWLGGSNRSGVFLTELDGPGSQRAVIKLLPANYVNAQAQLLRWSEASKLSHPHLMPLLHTGRSQVDTIGVVYSVTDYAEEVLADVLKDRALSPEETKEMLVPVLDALFYLHSKRYVHGHLKPSNILVVRNQVQLSGDELEVVGEPGMHFRGLSVYDAPETGTAMMASPADVWSLGMTLVEVLTQHPPEWGREKGKEPVIPEELPQPFARMVQECLRLHPEERCTLADVNKARFERVRAGDEIPEQNSPAAADVPVREEHEFNKRGVIAAVAAGLLLAAIATVFLWPRPQPKPPQTPSAATASEPARSSSTAPGAAKPEQDRPAAERTKEKPSAGVPETESVRGEGAQTTTAPENTSSGNTAPGTSGVVQRVMPEALPSALHTIHGTVRVKVRLDVDASGNVTNATFASAGPSRYFARLAMAAAQKWRFTPGAAGERVVEFDFRQTGVAAAVK